MKKTFSLIVILIISITAIAQAATFTKRNYEEIFLYHEFARSDDRGWLEDAETLSTVAVTCYDSASVDKSSTMISDATIITGNQTSSRVKYKVKAGTAGETYTIKIKVVTSTGQKFEDQVTLKVVS